MESDTEKAFQASRNKHRSVNRMLRDALSPSPEPIPSRHRDRRSPSRDRSRTRSRSPRPYQSYNRDNGRNNERDDGRRDDRRHRQNNVTAGVRPRRSDHVRASGTQRDDHDSHRHKRQRNGHSPAGRHSGIHSEREPQNLQTVRGERKALDHSTQAKADGTFTYKMQPKTNDNSVKEEQSRTQSSAIEMSDHVRFADFDSNGKRMPEVTEKTPSQVGDPLSIEERRRRREAIKAKHKISATPLLAQALQSQAEDADMGAMTPMTDDSDQQSVDSSIAQHSASSKQSPATPSHDFVSASFPTISTDADLANPTATSSSSSAVDPSAADYDPTLDMREEEQRARTKTRDVSSSAYDETNDNAIARQDVLLPEPPSKTRADDMFASDDEDMFAPDAAINDLGGPTEALPVPQAKELDVSLLDNWDDIDGYYKIILGELLDGRYHVQAILGKGMFSSVLRAHDTKLDRLVAIKVIRNNETMAKAGMKEIEILEKLAEADPEDKKHVIRLERFFVHKDHLCMVFENLSINLREVLKKFGRDVGINLKAVRSYAHQMFLGLSLFRKCNILHADLKPDNVLVNDARSMLKICDLGSAADASENEITPYLVSRFYRAPEIILGIPYDFAIDMWSIGCTLFELYTGKILFTGRTNNQMLKSVMECRGKFSLKMLKKAEFGAVHFDDHNLNFRSMERDPVTGRDVVRLLNFVKPTRDLRTRLLATATGGKNKVLPEADLKEVNLFTDLLDKCLALNPERRLTPLDALKHPFIFRPTTGSK